MNTEAPAVVIFGARKVYRPAPWSTPRVAVEDVSMEVPQGVIHGVLGANGAGKTTTMKMLLGLVRPDGGVFEVLGKPSRVAANRAPIGFLPEQPYFPGQLTATQAMRLYLRLAGTHAGQHPLSIEALLEQVGLGRHAHARLSQYSRGMLQRLGIAQALVGDPRVVVLDEPASGLDPIGQREVRDLMQALRARGVTVLLSSHQLSEVEAVCDRVSIIDRGRVAAEGRLLDLLSATGRTSVRARDLGRELPRGVASLAEDIAASGGVWVFSVRDDAVRRVVDAIDDAGGRIEALTPKHESLEEYFARLLGRTASGEGS